MIFLFWYSVGWLGRYTKALSDSETISSISPWLLAFAFGWIRMCDEAECEGGQQTSFAHVRLNLLPAIR